MNPAMRFAEAADIQAIADLVNTAFRPERFFVTTDRTNPEKVAALFLKGKFILIFDGGALAGCVYIELRAERGYFGLLAVDPARQHGGFGRQLIEAAENYCRAAGCRFMDLTFVNLRQKLPGYYRRFGYVESGVLPFPPDQHPNQPVHLVCMSKP
ncbi:MAG: GNAT family N-acetyltransferase, partial [Terriglobales bacterium]